jgi:NAD(P)H-flavin reductase
VRDSGAHTQRRNAKDKRTRSPLLDIDTDTSKKTIEETTRSSTAPRLAFDGRTRPYLPDDVSAPRRHRLRLVAARMLSPSVRGLTFDPIGDPLRYRAGQSLNLFVPTDSGLVMRRPYSVASAPYPVGNKTVDFAVTRVASGPTPTALHGLAPGATVEADGPNHGWLSRREGEEQMPALFVATGSGLAPFRALLQAALARPDGPPVALLFGCRTQADIVWRDDLERWAADVPRFSLTVTLSQPDPGWRGAAGRVQRHLTTTLRMIHPEIALLCGLSPMTDSVERDLTAAGIPAAAIRVEAYDA